MKSEHGSLEEARRGRQVAAPRAMLVTPVAAREFLPPLFAMAQLEFPCCLSSFLHRRQVLPADKRRIAASLVVRVTLVTTSSLLLALLASGPGATARGSEIDSKAYER